MSTRALDSLQCRIESESEFEIFTSDLRIPIIRNKSSLSASVLDLCRSWKFLFSYFPERTINLGKMSVHFQLLPCVESGTHKPSLFHGNGGWHKKMNSKVYYPFFSFISPFIIHSFFFYLLRRSLPGEALSPYEWDGEMVFSRRCGNGSRGIRRDVKKGYSPPFGRSRRQCRTSPREWCSRRCRRHTTGTPLKEKRETFSAEGDTRPLFFRNGS